ncbi:MAG: amidohydrolase, partial [Erythrobacter sp.]|nr:amidohydrolase [Erythrobacter sp.]
MKRLLQIAVSALALGSAPALAQDVTITNARLVLGDGGAPIEGGTVVVRGGSVVYAGPASGAPTGGASVDAGGAWVTS